MHEVRAKIAASFQRIQSTLKYILIGIVALTGWLSYERYHALKPIVAPISTEPEVRVITPPSMYGHPPGTRPPLQPSPAPTVTTSPAKFVCDGRTHCSQITSCDEAKFFLANCPGAKMDNHGNGNGIPCERQWCKR